MLKRIIRSTAVFFGMLVGYIVSQAILNIPQVQKVEYLSESFWAVLFTVIFCLIFATIFYFSSPQIYKKIREFIKYIERNIQKLTVSEILYGSLGAFLALVLVALLTKPVLQFNKVFGPLIVILINIISAIIGADIMIKKKSDITNILLGLKKNTIIREKKQRNISKVIPKIVDTSVIIDGRIFDICDTGFIEGPLIIPNFVLDELRHISDSEDSLKRIRGRRGLDILNKIQKELKIETKIWEGDFKNIEEVDSKLLKLAQKLNGKVLTNDYNLNKVAEVQGVPVLNINELSNALKPVVIPGEDMNIEVVKEGKEASQGLAYLDDGTMIVVEGGKKYIGKNIEVLVTSVLQTAAGRMIFAKPKN